MFVDNWAKDLFENPDAEALLQSWREKLAPFYEEGSALRKRTIRVCYSNYGAFIWLTFVLTIKFHFSGLNLLSFSCSILFVCWLFCDTILMVISPNSIIVFCC